LLEARRHLECLAVLGEIAFGTVMESGVALISQVALIVGTGLQDGEGSVRVGLERFSEKSVDFSLKKARQNKKLEKNCDSEISQFALVGSLKQGAVEAFRLGAHGDPPKRA